MKFGSFPLLLIAAVLTSCGNEVHDEVFAKEGVPVRPEIYAPVRLTADLSAMSEDERRMIPLLIRAAEIMDAIFWKESFGDRERPSGMDRRTETFFDLNYGPWDRLEGNRPFMPGYGLKPPGAGFYPADMKEEEYFALKDPSRDSPYTMIRRDTTGKLVSIPYHIAFFDEIQEASGLLHQAAAMANSPGLKNYLEQRAEALLNDSYIDSDIAWLDMKDNVLDVIIGPIENYEDKLMGTKTAHACYIAVKDLEWSSRLEHYIGLLPGLQQGLPVDPRYKQEQPGLEAQLGAYDVIYYAGDCNAGSKTIAVNLPNDEGVQLAKGTRRLQFKNAMRAKFEKIMVPIGDLLIDPEQRAHITFEAFFQNTMFHEVAHGLGIKRTVNGSGTVREALAEEFSWLEEGKADILGLYMVAQLREQNELSEGELMDNYVTFLTGILRSVRFGTSSAHGQANMVRFNYFLERDAFQRNSEGTYTVNREQMTGAMNELAGLILTLQGNGDIGAVHQLLEEKGQPGLELSADLERLTKADIPVDIVFEQGLSVLGLDQLP